MKVKKNTVVIFLTKKVASVNQDLYSTMESASNKALADVSPKSMATSIKVRGFYKLKN